MPPRPKNNVLFFKVPPLYYLPAIVGGMSLCTVVAIAPDLIPYDSLWYFGRFLHLMAYDYHTLSFIICCAAWVAHLFEAAYAYTLCRRLHLTNSDTLKWTVQTFILGFPSLGLLKAKVNKTSR